MLGEHPLDPRVQRTVAQFFGFERARAKFVDCECSDGNTIRKFEDTPLNSSPVQELPGGATRFEIVNESGYQATVLVGPPTCTPVVLPKASTRSLDVVPDKPHQISANITDSHVNVPLFPSYGQETFRFGWLHRMHLRPVRIEPQR